MYRKNSSCSTPRRSPADRRRASAAAPRRRRPGAPLVRAAIWCATTSSRGRRRRAGRRRRRDEETDDERPGGGISIRSVFVFLVLVVCAYGALTWTLLDDPDWAGRLARTLPMIGKEVRERDVGQEVALIEVQGRYERTKEGKLVFLVTGKAVNHSAESLRGVQVDRHASTTRRRLARGADQRLRQSDGGPDRRPQHPPGRHPARHQAAARLRRAARRAVPVRCDLPRRSAGSVATFSTEVARAQRQA